MRHLSQVTALPQAPSEPTGRRQRTRPNRHRPPQAVPRDEVELMATITKLRKKIERVQTPLNGWRMRWYMQ